MVSRSKRKRPAPTSQPTLIDLSDAGNTGNGVAPERVALSDRFVAPPFSVLDARQGYWRARKDAWFELGLTTIEQSEAQNIGLSVPRENTWIRRGRIKEDGKDTTSSTFDPVLAEVVYRWFMPDKPDAHALDPFGGEAVKGIVAAYLGYHYTGVELRQAQIDENRVLADRLGLARCEWVCGDSTRLGLLLPQGAMYDLVFTSPPYYDLEIYSKHERDASGFDTYDKFMQWYTLVFAQAVLRLRTNRFLVVKVGNIRDENGFYRNFVGDNVVMFTKLGLRLYNEAVLITPIGSLPLRAQGYFFASRKLAKGHQDVLVFYKGKDHKDIKKEFGNHDFSDETS